jgi:hypothetical protein
MAQFLFLKFWNQKSGVVTRARLLQKRTFLVTLESSVNFPPNHLKKFCDRETMSKNHHQIALVGHFIGMFGSNMLTAQLLQGMNEEDQISSISSRPLGESASSS